MSIFLFYVDVRIKKEIIDGNSKETCRTRQYPAAYIYVRHPAIKEHRTHVAASNSVGHYAGHLVREELRHEEERIASLSRRTNASGRRHPRRRRGSTSIHTREARISPS